MFWLLFLPTAIGFAIWWAGMKSALASPWAKIGIAIQALWSVLLIVGAFIADEQLSPGGFPLLVLGIPAVATLIAASICVVSYKNALRVRQASESKE